MLCLGCEGTRLYPGVCMSSPGCRYLDLDYNSLTGTIPDGISALSQLRSVVTMDAMHCLLLPTAAVAVLLVVLTSRIAEA